MDNNQPDIHRSPKRVIYTNPEETAITWVQANDETKPETDADSSGSDTQIIRPTYDRKPDKASASAKVTDESSLTPVVPSVLGIEQVDTDVILIGKLKQEIHNRVDYLIKIAANLQKFEEKIDIIFRLRKLKPSSNSTLLSTSESYHHPTPYVKTLQQLFNIRAEISYSPEFQITENSSASLQRMKVELFEYLKLLDEQEAPILAQIADFQYHFRDALYDAIAIEHMISNTAHKIGHRDLKKDAESHLAQLQPLLQEVKERAEECLKVNDEMELVINDNVSRVLSLMLEIEQYRRKLNSLLSLDKKRSNQTTIVITIYVLIIVIFAIFITFYTGDKFIINDVPLNDKTLKLPLIGIPWPVVIWSLLGSFAAMIYRLNKKPIYDFGGLFKWLITRPVQGVVLGSVLYLVLNSGLFLLTGSDPSAAPASSTADEVTLILSFLISFSDRFADKTFNMLIARYSGELEEDEESDDRPSDYPTSPPTRKRNKRS